MSTNEPMTKEQIDAIASRAAAAERGPWCVMNGGDNETSTFIDGPEGDVLIRDWRGSGHLSEEYVWVKEPNAEFIAHAREDIPALLAEVERLHDELAKTRAVTEDKVEVACKAFYEAGADKLDDTIRPQWDNLARFSPDIAQGYRERVSAALAALLGGGQV